MNVNDQLKTLRVGDIIKATRTMEVTGVDIDSGWDDETDYVDLKDVQSGTEFSVVIGGNHGSWSFEMVKKAVKKPKVGDEVPDDLAALPLGTHISGTSHPGYINTPKGWLSLSSGFYGKLAGGPRTILYLPE